MKIKLLTLVLIAGLITACGSQPTEAPAPAPTDEPAPATSAPTNPPLPTDTAIPPTAEPPTAEPTTPPVAGTTVSFATDVLPLLTNRCLGCHGGDRTQAGLSVKTYETILAGSENGPVITAGDAASSLLVELLTNQEMPKRGPKLTSDQVKLLTDWVNEGALNN